MALAYISFAGMNNGNAEFYADIGTNQFFRYRIGNAKGKTNGLDMLDDVVHQSAMMEQENSNPFNSRFLVKVPGHLFSKNRQYIQLNSYGDKDGRSPALSQVVEVYPQADLLNNEWPPLSQSKQMSMRDNNHYAAAFNKCRSVSFSFKETGLSNAMIFDAIMGAAKVLAPIAIKAIAGLAGSPAPVAAPVAAPANAPANGTVAAPVAPPPAQGVTSDDIMKLITAIIAAVGKNDTAASKQQSARSMSVTSRHRKYLRSRAGEQFSRPVKALSYSNGFSYKGLGGQKKFRDHKKGFAKQQFIDGGVLTGPLLASLIGPLVQQAPQLLQVLGDTPIKWLNAKNEAELKQQIETNKYLSGLLAQHNQAALMNLLAHTGQLGANNPAPVAMSFSKTNSIDIAFDTANPVTVSGKKKYVYQRSSPVKLLLHVITKSAVPDRPIPKAMVQLQVKEAATLKLVFEKKYRMTDVFLNSMLELELLPQELLAMPLNTDLLVSASFIYPAKSQKSNVSKSQVHVIYLVNEYFLTGSGTREAGDVPLTDMIKYRVFWNKIWEGSAKTKSRWQTNLDTKYYIFYKHDAESNGRIETKLKLVPQEDEANSRRLITDGKLKSGMEIAPGELNKLLPEISHFPLLDPQQLQAFHTDDLQKQFNMQASARLELHGIKDETGVIWAYPEVAVHKFMLAKAAKIDEKGQVTELTEEAVHFPCLTSIHFAGLKTV